MKIIIALILSAGMVAGTIGSALASTSNGQQGFEGQPGNQGNGQGGYEGQPGNQGGG